MQTVVPVGISPVDRLPDSGIYLSDARQIQALSGIMAAGIASDGEVVHFRWTSTTKRCAVYLIQFSAGLDAAIEFAAGSVRISTLKFNTWTASGTGGALVDLSGGNAKLDSLITASDLPELRVSTTAALGAGTKTIEQRMGGITRHMTGPIAAGPPANSTACAELVPNTELFAAYKVGGRPLVLNTNEGFAIRVTVPATGTWRFQSLVAWAVI